MMLLFSIVMLIRVLGILFLLMLRMFCDSIMRLVSLLGVIEFFRFFLKVV